MIDLDSIIAFAKLIFAVRSVLKVYKIDILKWKPTSHPKIRQKKNEMLRSATAEFIPPLFFMSVLFYNRI